MRLLRKKTYFDSFSYSRPQSQRRWSLFGLDWDTPSVQLYKRPLLGKLWRTGDNNLRQMELV